MKKPFRRTLLQTLKQHSAFKKLIAKAFDGNTAMFLVVSWSDVHFSFEY